MIDPKVKKYSEELKKLGIEHKIAEHPELKTPSETLSYLGLTLADGSSTLVMKADNEFVAVIRRDDCKLDFAKIKKELDVNNLRMASEEEFTKLTGLPVGAARVFNPELKTLLDKKLFEKDYLTGGSGSFTYSIQSKTEDLKKIPDSVVVDIAKIVKETDILKSGKKRILSGITPSGDGTLHIGNYLGAVAQFIEFARTHECFLMVADLHALTTIQNRETLQKNTETLIINELALLGDLTNIVFFRQSDVLEHAELTWILNNVTPLGLLKRAHAYKDKLTKDVMEEEINLGLFNYPILMASDILLYKPDFVPVGKDQKQHIEICRDIAGRLNKTYKADVLKLPEPYIPEDVAVVMGTDGKRKMSKSLGNIIGIFEDESVIKKQVMSTYTDPTRIRATDPGHIEGNMVFNYLDFFGDPTSSRDAGLRGASKTDQLKEDYKAGKIGDVEVKNYLFESLMKTFKEARERYQELKSNPAKVKKILSDGAEKARQTASKTMIEVREAIGLTNKYSFFRYS